MDHLDKIMDDAIELANATPQPPAYAPTPDEEAHVAEILTKRGYLPYDRDTFRTVCRYGAARIAEKATKGLWLYGSAGVGKTFLLRALLRKYERIVTATAMVSAYRTSQDFDARFWNTVFGNEPAEWPQRMQFAYLDDVGQEGICVSYGERVEVLDGVLCALYDSWYTHGTPLVYMTSNLNPEQMDARYGRRITDRLRDMCYTIEIKGPSRRGQKA
jgi:chromosomal replication initiation ATPase DnaA